MARLDIGLPKNSVEKSICSEYIACKYIVQGFRDNISHATFFILIKQQLSNLTSDVNSSCTLGAEGGENGNF